MDEQVIAGIRQKMQKALEIIIQDFRSIRSGRVSPQVIENVVVVVYSGSQKLRVKELATITTSDARTLIVSPFDPSITDEVVHSLAEQNLGFNPQKEASIIRITIPPLTEERRQEYLKLVHTKAEGGRVMIRQIRHDAMVGLKRQLENKEIDEDSKKRIEKRIQELTDEMIIEIDSLLTQKEAELMKI